MSIGHSGCNIEKILHVLSKRDVSVHFFGVGGVGMYSLFRLTRSLGIDATGSDMKAGEYTEKLASEGYRIDIGCEGRAPKDTSLGVYSLALSESDEGLIELRARGVLLVSRAEYEGAIALRWKVRIGVSGSHGKSTTVAMLDKILSDAGLLPTTLSGAHLTSGEPYRIGGREYLIMEACEYKDSFLYLNPTHRVFLNLELDHVDYFNSYEDIRASFMLAAEDAEVIYLNADDEGVRSLSERKGGRRVTFSEKDRADVLAKNITENRGKYSFSCFYNSFVLRLSLNIIGRHNVMNAMAALSVSLDLGIAPDVAVRSLEDFLGIERRIEGLLPINDCPVFYDYAHHPTEVSASIKAVREASGFPVAVIFRPHTYSRTKAFLSGFAMALSLADRVYVLDIDGVREDADPEISSERLVSEITCYKKKITKEQVPDVIEELACHSIIIMGAADMSSALAALNKKKED